MKPFGIVLLVIGALWAIIAFNMDTTVETKSRFIGDTYIQSQKVHNIGKMDARRNHLMLSGLLIVVGVVLFGFGTTRPSSSQSSGSEDTRKCPYCAEMVKAEATICRFCQKDLPPLPLMPCSSVPEPNATKPCPYCKEDVIATSDYCMRCGKHFVAS